MNRKHRQVTKTPKKVSRNSGGCWKFTSPACLPVGLSGQQGVGGDNQTNFTQERTGPPETCRTAKAGRTASSTSMNLSHPTTGLVIFQVPAAQ